MEDPPQWFVYVLLSGGDGGAVAPRSYVGISTDPERRLSQHNGELPGGAKSTRGGRPWRVGRVVGPYASRGRAQQVEASLKRLSGAERRLAWDVPAEECEERSAR